MRLPVYSVRRAAVIPLVAGALAVAGLPVLAPPAVATAKAATETQSPEDVTERPDRVSAMVAARVTGHKVEDVSQRTEIMRVFAKPDGTWQSEVVPDPVRMQNPDGSWSDIDTRLHEENGTITPAHALGGLSISNGGDKSFAAMEVNGRNLEWHWADKLPAPVVDGSTATYKDVIPGGDLVVTALPSGFSHDLVLRERPTGPFEVSVPLITGGPKVTEGSDGGIDVKTPRGRKLISAPSPVMYDASDGAGGASDNFSTVNTTVTSTDSGGTVTLHPDMDYLSDPDTQYPVVIDPSYTTWASADTWVNSGAPTAVHPWDADLLVGTDDSGSHKYRTFMQFADTPWMNSYIRSASLVLRNFETKTCNGSAVQVTRVTESWGNGGTSWSNQPGVTTTDAASSSVAKGISGCPSDDVTWDVSAIVRSWATATNPNPNYGFRVAGVNESANSSFRMYRSNNYTTAGGSTGLRPRLFVNYDNYPDTPASFGSDDITGSGPMYWSRSLTPKLSAAVTDRDGGTVSAYFAIFSGSTAVWSGYGSTVASGGVSTATVPSGVLSEGQAYWTAAYAWDGEVFSGNAAASGGATKAITVDTSRPTVQVTASNYTDGQWRTDAPTSNTITLDGAGDVGSFTVEQDGTPSTLTADSSGDATTNWNPSSGWHTLRVTPVDKAGNLGDPVTFGFGVSHAGFTVPNEAARSTGTYPVSAVAAPGATSAEMSWRLSGASTWTTATEVTKSGSSWTGGVANGSIPGGSSETGKLLWSAIDEPDPNGSQGETLEAPALIELRVCFKYSAAPDSCTATRKIQLVPSGFDDDQPVADLGPASVALNTGEASISETDAVDSAAGMGRTFTSYDNATLDDSSVFGPGWQAAPLMAGSDAAGDDVIDHRAKDNTFVISYAAGGSQVFAKVDNSDVYRPVDATGDDTKLTFTAADTSDPAKLVLSVPAGSGVSTTTWELQDSDVTGDPAAWTLVEADPVGGDSAATRNTQTVTSSNQRIRWIQESLPGAATTCTLTTQTEGCRGLRVDYTGTGTATRVDTVTRITRSQGSSSTTTTTLATYTYDSQDRLAKVCGPAPDDSTPPLCSSYTYTPVSGRTLLAEVKPPGQEAWTFDYDSTGRLAGVDRLRPSGDPAGGTAHWGVDYNVSLNASGLPDLSASSAAQWGQTVLPTKAYAVYQPGDSTTDVSTADVYYTADDGRVINNATYGPGGWLVDAVWRDAIGNVTQELDGHAWATVQEAPAVERQTLAAELSSFTVYNTWGDEDTIGTRVVDEYGPARPAQLKDGTTGLFRTHTNYVYDDSPNVADGLIASRTSSTPVGVVVQQTTSAASADRTSDYDTEVVRNDYKAVVAGDGDGWTLGVPTRVLTQTGPNIGAGLDGAGSADWSIEVTRYDDQGRVIETRQPGGGADASGAGNDAHSTTTSYYTATGTGDCGGKRDWVGQICKSGPASQPPGAPIPTTWIRSYSDDLQPLRVDELSGSQTARTATATYDNVGRPVEVVKQTLGTGVEHDTIDTTYGYAPTSGLPVLLVAEGKSISTAYDTWGRVIAYTDALGTDSVTTYAPNGQVAEFDDSVGSYTYDYDSHGALQAVDPGNGVGRFVYSWSRSGDLDTVTYPNGMEANRDFDQTGDPVALAYSSGGAQVIAFSATRDVDSRTVGSASSASRQNYSYDRLQRLVSVQDFDQSGCTTRLYGFSASSDRTSVTAFGSDANGGCQQTAVTDEKTDSYDDAGRKISSGYTYDNLGRTTSLPASDTQRGAEADLALTYRANDMVASLSQPNAGTAMSYRLDAADRLNTITTSSGGVESGRVQYRYAAEEDTPALVKSSVDAGVTWSSTRYIRIPFVQLAGVQDSSGIRLGLSDLRGNLGGWVDSSSPWAFAWQAGDEYGSYSEISSERYGWAGAYQRSKESLAGGVFMGARFYNPRTGSFLTPDSVQGGNATPYTYPQDPINQSDFSGLARAKWYWHTDWRGNIGYLRVWFNKRETYRIFMGASAAGIAGALLAGLPHAAAKAAGLLGGAMAGTLALMASYAEHEGECLAVKIKLKHYWLPPNFRLTPVPYIYDSWRCDRRYRRKK